MKIEVIKKDGCLVPSTSMDRHYLDGIKNNTLFTVEIKQRRNAKFHRKFFALLSYVYDSQEKWDTVEQLLLEFKIKLEHFTIYVTTDGTVVYIPKSISFHSMDQHEFERFYSRAVDLVLAEYMPVEKTELDKAINRIMNFI